MGIWKIWGYTRKWRHDTCPFRPLTWFTGISLAPPVQTYSDLAFIYFVFVWLLVGWPLCPPRVADLLDRVPRCVGGLWCVGGSGALFSFCWLCARPVRFVSCGILDSLHIGRPFSMSSFLYAWDLLCFPPTPNPHRKLWNTKFYDLIIIKMRIAELNE